MPTGPRAWDLAGRLTVLARDLEDRQGQALQHELDPFVPAAAAADLLADVSLTRLEEPVLREVHNPAKDALTTAVDADRLFARYGSGWVEVPDPSATRLQIGVEPGVSLGACWADVVRPAMHQ